MRVDLSRLDALVPEQFLDGADVETPFEQVGRETVAQYVAGDSLGPKGSPFTGLTTQRSLLKDRVKRGRLRRKPFIKALHGDSQP